MPFVGKPVNFRLLTDQYLIMYLSKTWVFIFRIRKDIADFRKKQEKRQICPRTLYSYKKLLLLLSYLMVMAVMIPPWPDSLSSSSLEPLTSLAPPAVSSTNTGTKNLELGCTGLWGKSIWRIGSWASWRYP